MSTLTVPDTRLRAETRLLRAIRVLDRICAEPPARARLEAELGAELTHRLLASVSLAPRV